jgi:hypothetical protein
MSGFYERLKSADELPAQIEHEATIDWRAGFDVAIKERDGWQARCLKAQEEMKVAIADALESSRLLDQVQAELAITRKQASYAVAESELLKDELAAIKSQKESGNSILGAAQQGQQKG